MAEILVCGLAVIAVLFILGRIFPNSLLGRFTGVARAKAEEQVREAESAAALELRNKAIAERAASVSKDQETLAKAKAQIDMLLPEYDKAVNDVGSIESTLEKRKVELKALRDSDQSGSERAKQIEGYMVSKLSELGSKKKERDLLKTQIETSQATLARAQERIKGAADAVKDARRDQRVKTVELKTAEIDRKLAEAASSMSSDAPGQNLDIATRRLNEQIARNKAKAEIVRATDAADNFEQQLEREDAETQKKADLEKFLSN